MRSLPVLPRLLCVLLALWVAPVHAGLSPRTTVPTTDFDVGAGIWDITGPAAENMMAGYANFPSQSTLGIHQRLYSRAFVIATPLTAFPFNGKRVVFVSADLNQVSLAIKSAVVDKLQARYGGLYTDANVMLSATHTHTGPGGSAKYILYDIYTWGFQRQNFDAIVEGIYQSIVMAHDRLAHGCIRKNTGELQNANVNRSPAAFAMDPERVTVPGGVADTNKLMTLLKFQSVNEQGCYGDEVGLIDWFSVHATSMHRTRREISGDNKGWASFRFEQDKGATYSGAQQGGFVAAFASSDLGDASPNVCNYMLQDGCRATDLENTIFSGDNQFVFAQGLYNAATDAQRLSNELDYRHAFVRMDSLTVDAVWNPAGYVNGAGLPKTCSAAVGMSFAAGAEDGPSGMPFFYEGMTYGSFGTDPNVLIDTLEASIGTDSIEAVLGPGGRLPRFSVDTCQLPKAVLLPTGTLGPHEWTPRVLPVQVFRIGALAIVGVPGEMTTIAGRRLRATVQAELPGVTQVVIAGLANAYSGYITTPEEYDAQHYEGASTHFGRMTLPAYQQIAGMLARDLRYRTYVFPSEPRPADLCDTGSTPACFNLQTGVIFDDEPWALGWYFGDVRQDAAASYARSGVVDVYFQGAHPKNDLFQNDSDSYATVQKLNSSGSWVDVYEDTHPSVWFNWYRTPPSSPSWFGAESTCLACSYARVRWTIPGSTPAGTYRIRHRGTWKSGWDGSLNSYSGVSSSFTVP